MKERRFGLKGWRKEGRFGRKKGWGRKTWGYFREPTVLLLFLQTRQSIFAPTVWLTMRATAKKLMRDSWEPAESQLRDSWETAERQLKDSWKTAERQLKDSWKTAERQLTERLLRDYWLRDCWETAERQLRESWETERLLRDGQRLAFLELLVGAKKSNDICHMIRTYQQILPTPIGR